MQMNQVMASGATLDEFEPVIEKKIKTNRGRPRMGQKSIITKEMKSLYALQVIALQKKYEAIDIKQTIMTTQESVYIIQGIFNDGWARIFEIIMNEKQNFLNDYQDPADKNFEDKTDLSYLLKQSAKFEERKEEEGKIGYATIFMIIAHFFGEDIGFENFASFCKLLFNLSLQIEQTKQIDQQLSMNDFRINKFDLALYDFQLAYQSIWRVIYEIILVSNERIYYYKVKSSLYE